MCRRFPQLLVAIAENRVSLTVAGLLAPHLTEDNVGQLIADCAGKTKREVEERLVALRPKPIFEPSIRKAPETKVPAAPRVVRRDEGPTPPPPSAPTPLPPNTSPPIFEPARTDQFNFRFAAGREFKEKLERLADVLGVPNPSKHMAEILEQAVDIALDKKDIKRKRARRLQREASSDGAQRAREKSRPGEISETNRFTNSRYIILKPPAHSHCSTVAGKMFHGAWSSPVR